MDVTGVKPSELSSQCLWFLYISLLLHVPGLGELEYTSFSHRQGRALYSCCFCLLYVINEKPSIRYSRLMKITIR
ncbi:hypothetical protein BDV26DRAFT_260897 [Aspergillus bertholletiae]|uniref:Uncharacterized protein n=1 Tax=Aspergillus bertholletiae TaxID=1226010 RepID=A0A5N7BAN6_9EURO|nr:hypothetical protein BDV26DRAFT_260897 [Aspergillus bertholletiae]